MGYFKIYCSLPDDAVFIRKTVFMEEQGFVEEFDDKDAAAKHIVLYNDESEPMAVCRYFRDGEGKSYVVGRIAVLKKFRGKSCGAAMLREAERQIRAAGAVEIRLAAQVQAKEFYEKSGYSAVGKEFLDEHCPHIRMCKKLKKEN